MSNNEVTAEEKAPSMSVRCLILTKIFSNAWLDVYPATIAKRGNKIYKMTYYHPLSNNSLAYEALAIDVESGHVTDSWEYPDDYPDPLGISAGENCFWTLGFDVTENVFIYAIIGINAHNLRWQ